MNDRRAIEKNDVGALTDDQQSKLNSFKVMLPFSTESKTKYF